MATKTRSGGGKIPASTRTATSNARSSPLPNGPRTSAANKAAAPPATPAATPPVGDTEGITDWAEHMEAQETRDPPPPVATINNAITATTTEPTPLPVADMPDFVQELWHRQREQEKINEQVIAELSEFKHLLAENRQLLADNQQLRADLEAAQAAIQQLQDQLAAASHFSEPSRNTTTVSRLPSEGLM
ncbi:hypothetical protein BCR43DRAFT_509027 [Syncephalastrum racemosum]|uniref:Uncharacterized protein n=1 Tax=Syncephalastrum racemosum TaxID=13706 RepID=A0A1X2H0G4_SYNRA|nr:hypothetical protein BCR43DRAFT_509027 [Syncephalastrum racemosum]